VTPNRFFSLAFFSRPFFSFLSVFRMGETNGAVPLGYPDGLEQGLGPRIFTMRRILYTFLTLAFASVGTAQAQNPLTRLLNPKPTGCAGYPPEHYEVPGGKLGRLFDKFVTPIGRCVPNASSTGAGKAAPANGKGNTAGGKANSHSSDNGGRHSAYGSGRTGGGKGSVGSGGRSGGGGGRGGRGGRGGKR
jgi:hypothetical protein